MAGETRPLCKRPPLSVHHSPLPPPCSRELEAFLCRLGGLRFSRWLGFQAAVGVLRVHTSAAAIGTLLRGKCFCETKTLLQERNPLVRGTRLEREQVRELMSAGWFCSDACYVLLKFHGACLIRVQESRG